ncbi:MAG: tetratricopeptide repeat protein [Treponemataceae bacterium]
MRAEEYFSIASAYFDLGKYTEAERWFNLARLHEKTRFASEYNLARIAFQKNESEDAARRFENLLTHDPSNAMVLRAAAYSWMKAEKWDKALGLFERIADMLPETEDARYNFALALSSAGRLEEAVEKIKPYVARRPDDRESLLLLARTERKLGKPEAADRYVAALKLKEDLSVQLELAEVFESLQLYARALETFRALVEAPAEIPKVGKPFLRFRAARVMFLAGEDVSKSFAELKLAVSAGFNDVALIRALAEDEKLSESTKAQLLEIAGEIAAKTKTDDGEPKKPESEAPVPDVLAPDPLAPKGTANP